MPNLSRDAIDQPTGKRTKLGKIFAGETAATDGHVFDAGDLELFTELVDEGTATPTLSAVLDDAGWTISKESIRAYLMGRGEPDGPLWGSRRPTGE